MNSQHSAANNTSEQAKVIVVDEFASIEKYLEGHPQRQGILEKIQNYQSQLLRQERNQKA
ncbi:MAG: hypothetical protein RMY28_031320 [Nostoc sp. ChiSLP01]|nr:hypothetical protein [Nostoc sp. CmiSLP01]MDZ8288454.1 hypothetical protein [Nostoc sp. ChiSLP01]